MNRRWIAVVVGVALAWTAAPSAAAATPDFQTDLKADGAGRSWDQVTFGDGPDRFQFVIMADPHGGGRPGVWADAVRKVAMLRPEFVMSVGDLTGGVTNDPAGLERLWGQFDADLAPLAMPFFPVPGNHDISYHMPNSVQAWKKRYGRTHYHFVYKNVLFVVLDSLMPANQVPAQLKYVKDTLAQYPNVRWTCLFMHHPYWAWRHMRHWEGLDQILAGRKHTFFAGHTHVYRKSVRNGQPYYVLATTGGVSGLGGPRTGQFDHVMWVTMTDDGPRVSNLMAEDLYAADVIAEGRQRLADYLGRNRWADLGELTYVLPDGAATEPTLILHNPNDVPMTVEGAVAASKVASPAEERFRVTAEPGTDATVRVPLRVPRPGKVPEISYLTVALRATYDAPGGPPIRHELRRSLPIIQALRCPRRTQPIQIDGQLDDWPALPIVCNRPVIDEAGAKHWQGPRDCAFRLGVAYDDRYVYVAIETRDDTLVLDPKAAPAEQDSVHLTLARGNDPDRAWERAVWGRRWRRFLPLVLAPGKTPTEPIVVEAKRLRGIQRACVATQDGLNVEVAVPIPRFQIGRSRNFAGVRLNVQVNDRDRPGGPVIQAFWRPDWSSRQRVVGSGTFLPQPTPGKEDAR